MRAPGGIVLAGGRSTRMGADKAALDWRGVALLDHVVAIVGEAVKGPIVIVGPSRVRSPVHSAGDRTRDVEDAVPGEGPLRGIATGLAALAGEADLAFVGAVDMPFVTPALVRSLLGAMTEDHDAVLANGNPLCAVYRTSLASNATQLLGRGERRARSLGASARTRDVQVDPDLLRDLDTPDDLANLKGQTP